MLIEDRRTDHAECVNNSRNLVILHASDFFLAQTTIQSENSKNKFAKLSYSVRGTY